MLSKIDLGAVIIKTAAIQRTGLRFLNSVPLKLIENAAVNHGAAISVSLLRAYHDCDWWMIYNAVHNFNLEAEVVPDLLFYHQ